MRGTALSLGIGWGYFWLEERYWQKRWVSWPWKTMALTYREMTPKGGSMVMLLHELIIPHQVWAVWPPSMGCHSSKVLAYLCPVLATS